MATDDRLLRGEIAVLGFGNQGEAQALNLRDGGARVVVGARAGHAAEGRARSQGFETLALDAASRRASVVAVLLPDEVVPELWPTLAESLRPDAAVVFAHGFNLLYGDLRFPDRADVVLVSPGGPGALVRSRFLGREGLPAYLAVHRDSTGAAWAWSEEYAARIGCARTWRTTVREETEVDLFGEQAVLCGGLNALTGAAFDALVAAGYAPEMAYLECVHQVKYLADLLHDQGLAGFRERISGTALFGDLTRGPRVVGDSSRAELSRILEEIRSGAFAREWRAEVSAGAPRLVQWRRAAAGHALEKARQAALGEPGGGPENATESRNALSKK